MMTTLKLCVILKAMKRKIKSLSLRIRYMMKHGRHSSESLVVIFGINYKNIHIQVRQVKRNLRLMNIFMVFCGICYMIFFMKDYVLVSLRCVLKTVDIFTNYCKLNAFWQKSAMISNIMYTAKHSGRDFLTGVYFYSIPKSSICSFHE